VAISVGHPRSFARPSLAQLRRSWYALFFQVPGVAERAFRARDWALFRVTFGGSPDFDRYLIDLSRPGALKAGLNWYRANGRPDKVLRGSLKYPRVKADTLGIWGSKENTLTEGQMTASERYVDGRWRYERIRAGHWAPLSRPDVVNDLLLDFLA
jgi:pimeloyl-ACP methyl ester carboxylesterase